eukprot:scaffold20398_cov184-Amphora_coffeaeformis.AAC.5
MILNTKRVLVTHAFSAMLEWPLENSALNTPQVSRDLCEHQTESSLPSQPSNFKRFKDWSELKRSQYLSPPSIGSILGLRFIHQAMCRASSKTVSSQKCLNRTKLGQWKVAATKAEMANPWVECKRRYKVREAFPSSNVLTSSLGAPHENRVRRNRRMSQDQFSTAHVAPGNGALT